MNYIHGVSDLKSSLTIVYSNDAKYVCLSVNLGVQNMNKFVNVFIFDNWKIYSRPFLGYTT